MSKFKNSDEAIDSALLLWSSPKHTNTSVSEVYDVNVFPMNSIVQGAGQIVLFNLPPQETGFLIDVEVVSQFHVNKNNANIPDKEQVSIVNNIAAAMFSLVEVRIEDRINLLQQMSNSYNLATFFETVLNNAQDREDILYTRELFSMDSGADKSEADASKYIEDSHHHVTAADIKNKGASRRAQQIAGSKKNTVVSKLNVPLFRHHKGILPNTHITVTFTINKNEYCIMAEENVYQLVIDDMFLKCTYMKPNPMLLDLMKDKLKTHPVIYECDKQLISARMLPAGSQQYTINNMFEHQLPKFVLFALQHPEAMSGNSKRSNFTFYPIKSLQMYINNRQFFAKPLTNEKRELIDQIYKSIGRDLAGSCMVTGSNIVLYQFYTLSLTDDRTLADHYSLKKNADTRVEIDVGSETEENYVLLAYCLYDIQLSLDGAGNVSITE